MEDDLLLAQVLLDAFANTEIDGMNVANGLEVMETTKNLLRTRFVGFDFAGLDGLRFWSS